MKSPFLASTNSDSTISRALINCAPHTDESHKSTTSNSSSLFKTRRSTAAYFLGNASMNGAVESRSCATVNAFPSPSVVAHPSNSANAFNAVVWLIKLLSPPPGLADPSARPQFETISAPPSPSPAGPIPQISVRRSRFAIIF